VEHFAADGTDRCADRRRREQRRGEQPHNETDACKAAGRLFTM
jgi:hypothetical protein